MLRPIRSFVVRGGRMTAGQRRAFEVLWPRFGLDAGDEPLDLEAVFARSAKRTLEIGFGNGEHLAALAAANPDCDFVGIDVHRPGVGRLLLTAETQNLQNVRVLCRDAVEVLQHSIASASLDTVLLYFPDPWPKKRHHKRRIVQDAFVELVGDRLKPDGQFRLATDWEPYAQHMLAVLARSNAFTNLAGDGGYVASPTDRVPTRFERRGNRLGHGVWDLAFRKKAIA